MKNLNRLSPIEMAGNCLLHTETFSFYDKGCFNEKEAV